RHRGPVAVDETSPGPPVLLGAAGGAAQRPPGLGAQPGAAPGARVSVRGGDLLDHGPSYRGAEAAAPAGSETGRAAFARGPAEPPAASGPPRRAPPGRSPGPADPPCVFENKSPPLPSESRRAGLTVTPKRPRHGRLRREHPARA